MSNPIEDLLEEKKKVAAARAARDLTLWQTWHERGRKPEHLEPLLDAYQPLISSRVREWKPPLIADSAMEAEITGHVIQAFQTYNPKRGASLNTWVQHRVQKAKRYMVKYQNRAYIPETPAYQIGNIQRAHGALTEELGRPPNTQEIADYLKMPVRRVTQIQKSIRKDIPSSALETDPMPHFGSREQEVLSLLPSILTPDEKAVFDLVYHPDTSKRVVSTSAIARKLGKSDSQISRLKTSIIEKTKPYL